MRVREEIKIENKEWLGLNQLNIKTKIFNISHQYLSPFPISTSLHHLHLHLVPFHYLIPVIIKYFLSSPTFPFTLCASHTSPITSYPSPPSPLTHLSTTTLTHIPNHPLPNSLTNPYQPPHQPLPSSLFTPYLPLPQFLSHLSHHPLPTSPTNPYPSPP